MQSNHYPFENLPLPYEYNALEPYIDEKTMHLHHDKHLQTYVNNLNNSIKDHPELHHLSLEQLIETASQMPEPVQTAVRNNAGGVYNHRFYFDELSKDAKDAPSGALAEAITRDFGSFEQFQAELKKAALSVFGSGYAWLVRDGGALKIMTTPNQNSPLEQGLCPILLVDVWEHAYYVKHYNVRADYLEDWKNVVDWNKVENNYTKCI